MSGSSFPPLDHVGLTAARQAIVDQTCGYLAKLGDLARRVLPLAVAIPRRPEFDDLDALGVREKFLLSELRTARPRCGHARLRSVGDKIGLELRNERENADNEAANRLVEIKVFLEALERRLGAVDVVHDLIELADVARDPIQLGNNKGVLRPEIAQDSLEHNVGF